MPNKYPAILLWVMVLLTVATALLGMRFGAVDIGLSEMYHGFTQYWLHTDSLSLNERIFMTIRLPRTILCMTVGASLAVGGTLMQALFRNPIVEPGLVGTSSGAAFGAALYFVLGGVIGFQAGEWTLPLAACLGAIASTSLVFLLARSQQHGKFSIVGLLLTGIAINALFLSGVGFLSYIARDPQARSITFWNLGTLSGANWRSVGITAITTITGTAISLRYAKQLNALIMGEEEARYLGVATNRLKVRILFINVVMVAVATAFVGVIGFVGLIVPHVLRLLGGADNRTLIINSAFLGATLLNLSDLAARVLLQPAELPIGIVLSIIGVPVFLYLLRKKQYHF